MTWHEDRIIAFFLFICERHEMWVRRFLDKKPPPWTSDLVLQTLRTTCVYRDLDRATRYLITTTLDRRPALSREALLFNIIVFRSFTKEETYAALGAPYGYLSKDMTTFEPRVRPWDRAAALKSLRARKRAGHTLFTGAYMFANCGSARPKHEVVVSRLAWVHKRISKLLWKLDTAGSMEEAHKVLLGIPGIGGFNGAELLLDLCYEQRVLSFSMNEWIFAGPGACNGAAYLVGSDRCTQAAAQVIMRELEQDQDVWFKRAGARLHGPALTISDIENCLCELQKVIRARAGGHVKRHYLPLAPRPEGDLWFRLPAKYADPVYWISQD